ncbi:ATP-binding cassette domain-containing protein [Propioniciclava soli]|uniref:ATP-binding cassette domain-containing protein n=1 Tax=Propioniciclava soli TaxID=2775081 RepID=A0ABZ3C762_9ACTN
MPRAEIGPRVAAIAERCGITHLLGRQTGQLSGGEAQRVALAATLVGGPEVVLLDEPLSMLDPDAAADVAALLRTELGTARGTELGVAEGASRSGRAPAAVIVEHRRAELARAGVRASHTVALGRGCAAPARPVGAPGPAPRPAPTAAAPFRWHLTDVRRAPDGPVVLPGVDIALRPGTLTALTGPNGSGKSTLLLAIAGLLPAHRAALGAPRVGMVFQRPENQFVAHTVREEISWNADARRAAILLERVGLAGLEELSPHQLSLGQQRRLSLVAAAAQSPPVLLLDEPTFGLDDAGVTAVEGVLAGLRADGVALLVATHDRGLVKRLADAEVRLSAQPAGRSRQARPRVPDSFLARCSPVTTFTLVFVVSIALLFTLDVVPVLGLWALATAAALTLGRVPLRRLLLFQVPVAWFALSAFLVNVLSRSGGVPVAQWGPLTITDDGLAWGLALGARSLAIGALAALFALTTDAIAFLNAAHQQARVPARHAYALMAGYRLMEMLPEEWWTLRAAHRVRARGAGRDRLTLDAFRRAAFSLLVVALRRGQQLAEALEARGLGRSPRTVWRPVRWGWRDAALAAGATLTIVAVLAL